MSNAGFIYLIQTNDQIEAKNNVYKIGRTDNFNRRIK